jgi:hypothetical protein
MPPRQMTRSLRRPWTWRSLTLPLAKAACWAVGIAVILSCTDLALDAHAEEHWQYADTRRVDINGLAFAHSRPFLYLSFLYRGTERTILTPSAIVGIELETGKAVTDVLPCGMPGSHPVVSPNDAYLAYRFYEGAHLIGLRRLADGEMSVVPDESPGNKIPQFFSPDSKTLTYLQGIDPNDIRTLGKGEFLVEYSLDAGTRKSRSLGVDAAWNLQRLSDDRIIFMGMEPKDTGILRRLVQSESQAESLEFNSLIYTFDKSTGALGIDPVNRLSTYFGDTDQRRLFVAVQVTNGQRYYLIDNDGRAANVLVVDQGKLRRVACLEGREVWDFRISDDEKWLAYVYVNIAKDSPYWRDREYDKDLEIRNMVTGETRAVDLREPPFSDVANQQRSGCANSLGTQ